MQEYDIIILGAGPAGITASLFLAKEGIEHLIIEKREFPRDVICGDALSGNVIDVLGKLDKNIIKELIENKEVLVTKGIKFFSPDFNSARLPFPERKDELPTGLVMRRLFFDNFLFNKINKTKAEISQNSEIQTIIRSGEYLEICFKTKETIKKVKTKLLLAADGDSKTMQKQLKEYQINKKKHSVALKTYYQGVEGLDKENYLELHYMKDFLPGYLWVFPMTGGLANVGMGLTKSEVKNKKIKLSQEFEKLINSSPNLKERFKNAQKISKIEARQIPMSSQQIQIAFDNYMLLGDAASLVDPFTGEGVGNAMKSGMIAAKNAKIALEKNKFDKNTLNSYQSDVYNQVWNEIKLSLKLQKLSKKHYLFNYVVKKISSNKSIQRMVSSMFDNVENRSKIVSLSFYYKLLLNKN